MTDATYERVARSEDVRGPRFLRADVRGEPVLLTRLRDGTAIAFGTICPHQQLRLDDGVLWHDEIDCPHHHYTYDPRTGRNVYPRRVFPGFKAAEIEGIPTFEVAERDGWVLVGPRRDAPIG